MTTKDTSIPIMMGIFADALAKRNITVCPLWYVSYHMYDKALRHKLLSMQIMLQNHVTEHFAQERHPAFWSHYRCHEQDTGWLYTVALIVTYLCTWTQPAQTEQRHGQEKEKERWFSTERHRGRTEGGSHSCVGASDDRVSVKANKVIKKPPPTHWEGLLEVIQSNLLLKAELPSKLVQVA